MAPLLVFLPRRPPFAPATLSKPTLSFVAAKSVDLHDTHTRRAKANLAQQGVGQPGNCNDNLAGVPPIGVKVFAPCKPKALFAL